MTTGCHYRKDFCIFLIICFVSSADSFRLRSRNLRLLEKAIFKPHLIFRNKGELMKTVFFKNWQVLLIALPLALALITSDAKTWGAEKDAAKPAVKKKRAAAKGRLPNFYKTVVNDAQKKEIYAIQAKYAPQIKELIKQLTALKTELSAETEAVLTSEQKDQVAKLVAEAKAKRKKPSSPKKKAADASKPGKKVAGK